MADNFGLKIGVEGEKEFKKALSEINQSFKVLGSEMKLVASQFDKQDKSVEALSARNTVLNKEIETQKQKIETLRSALENAASSFGENDRRTQSWQIQLNNAEAALNNMERELSENEKAIDEMSDGMEDAEDSTEDFSDELDDAADTADDAGGRFEKLGSIAKGIGVVLAAAVVAIGAAVAGAAGKINDCVNVYAEFEDSMLQVAATMGITQEEIANGSDAYEKLTNAAKEAGASTRYSASEAGEALNYLALAGYDADKAVETLPKVLNLAAAGGMELATTSDLVTDAMSALQMETGDLDTFIDQMAKTSQKSNTSVQQLGEAILVCAGTATSTGQELTTLNTSLGILADNGIKGAEGGTKLRNVMLSLSAPTDKAAAQLTSLGVSVYDAEGNMRQLDEIMADLNASLGDLSQDERTNAINNIFNKTDLNAVNALLASTTGRFDELSAQIDDCAGAAADMAGTMEAGLAGTTRSFESAMEGMQIEVGSIFADFKQTLMSDSIEVIRNFTNNLREAGGDWGKIGEAIGQALSEIIMMVGNYLPQIVDMGMQIIQTLGSALMDNLDVLIEAATSIIMTLLNGVVSALPALVEAAAQIVVTLATGIGQSLPTLIPAIVQAITTIVQTLADNLPLILEAALQLVTGLAQGLLDAIPVLVEALPSIITAIVDFVIGAIPQIIDAGIQLLTSLISALPEIITAIVAAIPQIIDGLVTAVLGSIPQLIDAGVKLLISLIQNLPQIITTVVAAIPQIVTSLVNAIVGNIDKIILAGVQLFVALITNLPKIIVEIVKAVPQIIAAIVKGFASGASQMASIGLNLIKGIWNGIGDAMSWLWGKVSGFCSDLMGKIKGFFGIHSPSTEMAWIGEMLVEGLAGSIEDNSGEAIKAAEGLSEGISGVMENLAEEMKTSIPTDFHMDADASVRSVTDGMTGVAGAQVSGFGPLITIQQMIVRSEDDIRKISQELYNLMQVGSRAQGRIITA
jgi:TP901 family phage tail tape measure protein